MSKQLYQLNPEVWSPERLRLELWEGATGGEVPGTGPLYRYDTAFRIGAHLNLFPTLVYLHAGTRNGARALGLPGKDALELSDIPIEIRHREPHEIEDILCIYEDAFRGGRMAGSGCLPARSISRKRRC